MRAIGYRKPSPALDALEAFEIPRPTLESRDLLVEVRHESRPPDWPSLTVNDALGEIGAGLRLARDGLRPETAR